MVEFNPDGSIKLPGSIQKNKDKNNYRMQRCRCMRIRKEIVSTFSPKQCMLHLKLSDAIIDSSFVERCYGFFKLKAETPTKLSKLSDKEFEIKIETDFRRCSDCNQLINQFRNFLDGNVILDDGTCTQKKKEFCYEDHFD